MKRKNVLRCAGCHLSFCQQGQVYCSSFLLYSHVGVSGWRGASSFVCQTIRRL